VKPSKWILLAEDDELLAELTLLALAIEDLACAVIVAQDGLEALDCIRRSGKFKARADGEPAFVLLDLKMPKVDGLEVLQQLKSDARLKHIPVVMFSSSDNPRDIRRSYELGANAYVIKPLGCGKFNETLKQIAAFWVKFNETPSMISAPETKVPLS
jgi:CheY-like chemotaxis protein